MKSFQVEQAVFASSDRGSMKGYQLVARSAGIDRTCGQELCRWAPSQLHCDDDGFWTINFFPVSERSIAITRTVLGGPEYSSRGGIDVVTSILVLDDDSFACYACNAVSLAKTAMSMGHLRLPMDMTRQQLDPVELPGRPIVEPAELLEENQLLDEVLGLIGDARRVAIIGAAKPLELVDELIPRLSVEERRNFSFTTGLSPAVRRPFRAHFLPHVDAAMQRTLDSQQIVCVRAR